MYEEEKKEKESSEDAIEKRNNEKEEGNEKKNIKEEIPTTKKTKRVNRHRCFPSKDLQYKRAENYKRPKHCTIEEGEPTDRPTQPARRHTNDPHTCPSVPINSHTSPIHFQGGRKMYR